MTDLTIPDEAIALAVSVGRNTDSADGPAVCEAIVRTAAPLIVAAELRRVAAYIDGRIRCGTLVSGPYARDVLLLGRADELDPAGGK